MATSSYDDFPYLGFPRRHAHPSVISANARIFGVDAPPVENARVLELGCGDGANLLSIAVSLPGATCCGVDFSGTQIRRGQAAGEAAGIGNIALLQADFADASFPDDEYDYIIAHGVFSWITEAERGRMLELIRDVLSPRGVAFISYNCFPGWNFRKLTRDMMLFQTRKIDGQQEKVDMARRILPVIERSIPRGLGGYASLLKDEQKLVDGTGDYYIAHEHLEEDNQPCYFHEFAGRLKEFRLQYLCEAELASMYVNRYPNALGELQQEVPGTPEARIESEQLLDYAVLRMFRQSLICSADHPVSSSLSTDSVRSLYASAFGDFPENPVFSSQPESFQSSKGIGITTASPVAKAGMCVLARRWPERLSFEELVDGALALVPGEREPAEVALAELLLAAYTADGVELHGDRGNFTAGVAERPVASPLARYQAESEETAFSLRHLSCPVDPVSRVLIPKLDGTRTVDDLLVVVKEAMEGGTLGVAGASGLPDDPAKREEVLAEELRKTLKRMAEQGLFLME